MMDQTHNLHKAGINVRRNMLECTKSLNFPSIKRDSRVSFGVLRASFRGVAELYDQSAGRRQ